jgi:hypothetical protein
LYRAFRVSAQHNRLTSPDELAILDLDHEGRKFVVAVVVVMLQRRLSGARSLVFSISLSGAVRICASG